MSKGSLTRDQLENISERAFRQAKEVGDAGMRTALQLLGEAAANIAAKLPARASSAVQPGAKPEAPSA